VEKVMGRLTAMEREVFMLRFFDHLGIREISLALKKNESTVKTHLYKALTKIRQDPAAGSLMEGVSQWSVIRKPI
jgi:RNA polymerase sigma-70 factor (ECF subfamily)